MDRGSKVVLKRSNFRDRMFIKLQKNRKLIKEAAKAKDWPKTKDGDKSDSDPEYEVGEKRKKNEGMDIFMEFVNKTNKSAKPNKGIVMMMENLACSTSTIGMMQEFDEQLFNSIEKFLKGDQNCDLLSGIQNIELKRKVRNKYPILMKTLEPAADTGGNFEESFRYKQR